MWFEEKDQQTWGKGGYFPFKKTHQTVDLHRFGEVRVH